MITWCLSFITQVYVSTIAGAQSDSDVLCPFINTTNQRLKEHAQPLGYFEVAFSLPVLPHSFFFSKKNGTESEKNWLALFCHFNETSGNEADDGGVTRLLKRLRELNLANITFLMNRSGLSQSSWYCGGGEERNVPYKRCVFAHAGISQLPKCSRRCSSVSSFFLFFFVPVKWSQQMFKSFMSRPRRGNKAALKAKALVNPQDLNKNSPAWLKPYDFADFFFFFWSFCPWQ